MTQGFIIQAQSETDRKQALALAYSIKTSNPEASISLVCGDLNKIETKHEEPFDNIVEYPFSNKSNPRLNDWQCWWVTPYEESIVIDCACIVNQDLTTVWDYLSHNYELCFPGTIKDFRHQIVKQDKRHEFLEEYKLKSVHTAWFYFKKNNSTMDYFKLADPYMQNYIELFKHKFQPQHLPDDYVSDIMHGIVVNDMALENVTDKNLNYIDMDIVSDYFRNKADKWTDYLNVWSRDNGTVKIQNYATTGILFYKESDFLTEDIFNGQRDSYRLQTKVLRQVQQ